MEPAAVRRLAQRARGPPLRPPSAPKRRMHAPNRHCQRAQLPLRAGAVATQRLAAAAEPAPCASCRPPRKQPPARARQPAQPAAARLARRPAAAPGAWRQRHCAVAEPPAARCSPLAATGAQRGPPEHPRPPWLREWARPRHAPGPVSPVTRLERERGRPPPPPAPSSLRGCESPAAREEGRPASGERALRREPSGRREPAMTCERSQSACRQAASHAPAPRARSPRPLPGLAGLALRTAARDGKT